MAVRLAAKPCCLLTRLAVGVQPTPNMTGVRPQSGMSGLTVRCCYRHWCPSCMQYRGSVLDSALDRRASWFPNRWCIYSVSLRHRHSADDHQEDAVHRGEQQRPASMAPRRERTIARRVGQAGLRAMAGFDAVSRRRTPARDHLIVTSVPACRAEICPRAGDGAQAGIWRYASTTAGYPGCPGVRDRSARLARHDEAGAVARVPAFAS